MVTQLSTQISTPLTTISIARAQDVSRLIARRVFPVVPVADQSGFYMQRDPSEFYKTGEASNRAPGSEAREIGYTISQGGTYLTQEFAKKTVCPRPIRFAEERMGLNPMGDNAELVTDQLLLEQDQTWANTYFKTGVWSHDVTGVAGIPAANQVKQWDLAGATPVMDIRTEILAIELRTGGYKPNTLVLGPQAALQLSNAADITNRIQYVGEAFPNEEVFKRAFGIDQVIIGNAIINIANEASPVNFSWMYPKGALLVYAAPNPGLRRITGGYTFSWQGYLGGQAQIQTRTWYENARDSDMIEAQTNYDMRVVDATAGTFYTTVVS